MNEKKEETIFCVICLKQTNGVFDRMKTSMDYEGWTHVFRWRWNRGINKWYVVCSEECKKIVQLGAW